VLCFQEHNGDQEAYNCSLLFSCYLFLLLFKGSCIVKAYLDDMESLKAWLIGVLCCNWISGLAGVVYGWIELLGMSGARHVALMHTFKTHGA
jgi:hypothetical protein